MKESKVVFHISQIEKWGMLLGNIKNLFNDLGREHVSVTIVANGNSVNAYVGEDQKIIDKVNEFSKMGANFTACKNSLAAFEIDKDQLPKGVSVVSAGVSELIKKQSEGCAYIKV